MTVRLEIKARSVSTSKGIKRNGDIIELPEAEVKKIQVINPNAFTVLEEAPVFKSAKKKAPAKKKRARNANGTLKGDNPATPLVNEAYEQ